MSKPIFIQDYEKSRSINLFFVKEFRLSKDNFHAEILFKKEWIRTNITYENFLEKIDLIK